MVYSTPVFTAAAALSVLVPSVFAIPSPASKREEVMYYPPLWKSDFVTLDIGPIPEVVPISIDEITASANGTEAVAESWFPDPETILAERSIIGGVDNRVLWNNLDYPYTAMGRIERSDGIVCSASLIGPRHVATARHCVLPQKGQGLPSMKFQPNYYDGERLGSAYATVVYHIPTNAEPSTPSADPCFWKEDWAIMILDQRLGDKYGYLGAKIVANDQLNRAMFFNFGYPGDKSNTVRPWRQEGITIRGNSRCEATGPMDTDADIAGGNSGGPLWLLENGSRYQYAMCSAGGSDISIHSGGNNWLNAVINLRKDHP